MKVLIWKVLTSFVIMFGGPDSPGHKPDQSCPGLEEEPGAVRVQGEGHVDTQQLSGGVLDRKLEEPQPEGTEQLFSTTVECFTSIFLKEPIKCAAGRRDFVSKVSRKWGWGWWWGGGRAEVSAASGPVRGWGLCFLSILQLSFSFFFNLLQAQLKYFACINFRKGLCW